MLTPQYAPSLYIKQTCVIFKGLMLTRLPCITVCCFSLIIHKMLKKLKMSITSILLLPLLPHVIPTDVTSMIQNMAYQNIILPVSVNCSSSMYKYSTCLSCSKSHLSFSFTKLPKHLNSAI